MYTRTRMYICTHIYMKHCIISIVRHGVVRGTWYGVVWYGTVWYGMVRYGALWCAMVRYGAV